MTFLRDPFAEFRPRTNHAVVVSELGRSIISGRFPPGSVLPTDKELGERFDVSRTVLREAMKTLAAKNLVRPKARVGTRVLDRSAWNFFDSDILAWRMEAGLDETLLRDLAATRSAIEPAAAALAAERATPADIERLYAIADRLGDPGHDQLSIARVDLEFHLTIAEVSKNPFMRSISGLIEAALATSIKLSSPASDPAMIAECCENHRAIVDAVAARDTEASRAAMERVIAFGVIRTSRALRNEQ